MKKIMILLAFTLLLFGCSERPENTPDAVEAEVVVNENIIAVVNGDEIELEVFDKYYAMQSYDFEKEFGESIWDIEQDGKTMREIRQDQTLDYLIRVNLIEAYLKEKGESISTSVINDAYSRYMDSIKNDEEIKAYFAANGLDEVFLKRFLEDQYYLRTYEDLLLEEISNDPNALDYLFKDKIIRYKTRHILLEDQVSVDEVSSLLNDEENPADFSDMARLYSLHSTSAVKGGDLGYILVGNMPAAYEEVALTIEPYTVSEAIQTEYGYHIIFVDDRQMLQDMIDAGMPEEEIETYKGDIIQNYAAQETVRFFEEMKAGATIELHKELLNKEQSNDE